MRKIEAGDIIGKKFGELTVINLSRTKPFEKIKSIKYFYNCICSCGREIEIVRTNIITGHTASCGCKKNRKNSSHPNWKGYGDISGGFWLHIKRHAKERKISFNISIQDVWELYLNQNKCCALSGIPITLKSFKKDRIYYHRTGSLDRIDSTKGYEINNIHWIYKKFNWMKLDMPLSRFFELCSMVANYTGDQK